MRKRLFVSLAAAAALLAAGCTALRGDVPVFSPNGEIAARLVIDSAGAPGIEVGAYGRPFLTVCNIGLTAMDSTNLSSGFVVAGPARDTVCCDTVHLPWGENKRVVSHYAERQYVLHNGDSVAMRIGLRVFDDGVAFRYEYLHTPLPLTAGGEGTAYRLGADGTAWSIPANFESYEFAYRQLPISQTADANTPLTFRLADGRWGSLHEAGLQEAPEMTLRREDSLRFRCVLCPDNSGSGAVATYCRPPVGSWRTITIGRRAADLANSSLLLCCNRPDTMGGRARPWLRPIKYAGVWWGMHLGVNSWTPDSTGAGGRSRHGATTENALRYIDFAAANGIDGVLFEGWNRGWEQWGGRQEFDFEAAAPDFDAERVVNYARRRGVQIIMHHETGGNMPHYEARMERAFQWCQDHGIHYVKTGYAGGIPGRHLHHSQYAVGHYQRVTECAARHEIALDVHEPIKPTGLCRTWPNLMTGEGARGMEWNAWSDGNPPSHTVTLPFTRLLAGPMDYTPGIFDLTYRSLQDNPDCRKWNTKDARECRVHTTLAKQVALWVIIYSPMVMAADLMENYLAAPGRDSSGTTDYSRVHPMFQFFRDYNPDCDWSETIEGAPGSHVVVARGAGDTIFIGAATNEEARTIALPLDFLAAHGCTASRYEATLYADGEEADYRTRPEAYRIEKRTVSPHDTLHLRLAPGGGCAVILSPAAGKRPPER